MRNPFSFVGLGSFQWGNYILGTTFGNNWSCFVGCDRWYSIWIRWIPVSSIWPHIHGSFFSRNPAELHFKVTLISMLLEYFITVASSFWTIQSWTFMNSNSIPWFYRGSPPGPLSVQTSKRAPRLLHLRGEPSGLAMLELWKGLQSVFGECTWEEGKLGNTPFPVKNHHLELYMFFGGDQYTPSKGNDLLPTLPKTNSKSFWK